MSVREQFEKWISANGKYGIVAFSNGVYISHSVQLSWQAYEEGRKVGLREAAEVAEHHRQELFDDGLDADLGELDKRTIFFTSADQERTGIATAILALVEKEGK